MKTKRLLACLLAIVLCLTLLSCQEAGVVETEETETVETAEITETASEETEAVTKEPPASSDRVGSVNPLLYRVTDEDGSVVWLFGSIHVGREEYYPLPSYVLDAFDGADSLAVEADIVAFEKDMTKQMQALTALVYRDGTQIRDHVPEELYERAVAVLKESGFYVSLLDMYCASFWSSQIESMLIENLGGDIALGIDRHLINRAYGADKEIHEIESAQLQYQMLGDFSDELQCLLLESALEKYDDQDKAKEDLKEMMELWAAGDEEAFAAYLATEELDLTPEERSLYEEYNKAMLVERNISMSIFAEEALQDDEEIFICVGAAHVVGNGAMAQLLAARGYTVELITE